MLFSAGAVLMFLSIADVQTVFNNQLDFFKMARAPGLEPGLHGFGDRPTTTIFRPHWYQLQESNLRDAVHSHALCH